MNCTQKWEILDFSLFDTINRIKIWHHNRRPLLKAIALCNRLQILFNRFDPQSELSMLARNAKTITPLSFETRELLQIAEHIRVKTAGAFNIASATIGDLWGFGRQPNVPQPKEIEAAIEAANKNHVLFFENGAMCTQNVILDFGGIAKGYACDKIYEVMEQEKVQCGIIDLGGNIFPFGVKPDKLPWSIGIRSPFQKEHIYTALQMKEPYSVVTSGKYERFFLYEGERYHHIIDMKTGRPTKNNIASVTVISRKSVIADALSTAFFNLGVDGSVQILNEFPGTKALFIFEDKHCLWC